MDFARWTKGAFLCGVALFAIGTGGEYVLTQMQQNVPEWIHTLLIDSGLIGICIALLVPILFGIVLPLTE